MTDEALAIGSAANLMDQLDPIRAGLDAMLAFGRPASVQLLVLIDRRFSRELPIQPDYVGKWVDSIADQRVTVEWKETDGQDRVMLYSHRS